MTILADRARLDDRVRTAEPALCDWDCAREFAAAFGTPSREQATKPHVVAQLVDSPLGPLLIAATPHAVCLLEFAAPQTLIGRHADWERQFHQPIVAGSNEHLRRLIDELAAYFDGQLRAFTVPLAFPGTPFQMKVWRGLLRIPYGQTWSYEELAQRIGHAGAQRAVGSANGRNRIAIIIPCHRVVNKGGRLGGYGSGIWRKQALLELEQNAAGRSR